MKQLRDMTQEELWQLFPIQLKPYDARYPIWYAEEEQDLKALLQTISVHRINHIGSTSVEGLLSKPIIDILLELVCDCDIDGLVPVLEGSGWMLMQEDEAAKQMHFNKGYTPQGFAERVYHLHVKPQGDWDELYFRDYLRKYPEVAQEYERHKIDLKKRFEHDRDAYTEGKTEFIASITAKAREEFGSCYAIKKARSVTDGTQMPS